MLCVSVMHSGMCGVYGVVSGTCGMDGVYACLVCVVYVYGVTCLWCMVSVL